MGYGESRNGNVRKWMRRCNIDDRGVLCEELMIEILCRVSPRCLMKFKCVSRGWYCLITRDCVPRISPLPLSGIYDDSYGFVGVTLPTSLYQHAGTRFLSSATPSQPCRITAPNNELLDICNGLSLLFNNSLQLYYVWNFTTKHCVAFPPPCASARDYDFHSAALAFDPRESSRYRIVLFDHSLCISTPSCRFLQIFSSETGKWVTHTVVLGPLFPNNVFFFLDRCAYFNGAMYRLSHSPYLFRYDLETVNVSAIVLPGFDSCNAGEVEKAGCIGSSVGRLCYGKEWSAGMLIWMLDDVGEWILMHSVIAKDFVDLPLSFDLFATDKACLLPYEGGIPPAGAKVRTLLHTSFLTPLSIVPLAFDSASDDAVLLWAPGLILCYHFHTNKVELLSYADPALDPRYRCPPYAVFPFSQCVVPLKDIAKIHHCHK